MIGTFGKAFGMSGAFIAGERRLIDLVLQKGRTYIYSTALLPAVAATLIPAIALVVDAKKERAALATNIDLFKSSVERRSVSDTHIQPLIIGESDSALRASRQLYEAGILAMAIRPPTVPKGTARLRLSITAAHEKTHLEKLTSSIQGVFV